jgi:alkanesulfonate monooxygenase SsuD/methylene tetrahydromethanopterin reductase-like flavin-dependent oxidoreductase (luciferase family)
MFMMRFDLRSGLGTPPADLYAATLDMAAWGEDRGCAVIALSEHHASGDGYLPSPLVLAGAVVGRTKHVHVMIAAALITFYDPVRLAEDMAVLDQLSRGRVSYVFGLGYRPEEFALFGVDMAERGRRAEEHLDVLTRALRGEIFEHDGRTINVTPAPYSDAGPTMAYGGGSVAAARRAGRFGLGFIAQSNGDGLEEAYKAECERVGHEPGALLLPDPAEPLTVFVADDVDRAWDEVGPYLLHDAREYASWNPDNEVASISRGTTVDELRAEQGAHRVMTVEQAVEHVRTKGILPLHPLCGGLPPEIAWPYLERVADEVLPAAAAG